MIRTSVHIENSDIADSANIWNHARVVNSKIGEKVVVADFARVYDSEMDVFSRAERNNVITSSKIGRYTYFGMNSVITHSIIGQFCSISWGVTIGPPNHDYTRVTSHRFLYDEGQNYGIKPKDRKPAYNIYKRKTIIGNDVWIGANVVIANGVTVGDGAVIGANAMVTKDIPPYAIAVGNPAKILKYRFDSETIDKLLSIKWWNFPIEFIKQNYELFASNDLDAFIEAVKSKI